MFHRAPFRNEWDAKKQGRKVIGQYYYYNSLVDVYNAVIGESLYELNGCTIECVFTDDVNKKVVTRTIKEAGYDMSGGCWSVAFVYGEVLTQEKADQIIDIIYANWNPEVCTEEQLVKTCADIMENVGKENSYPFPLSSIGYDWICVKNKEGKVVWGKRGE